MVLSEVAQGDNAFPSEPSDDFSGPGIDSTNSLPYVSLDLNRLPRPMPILGPFFGFTHDGKVRTITRHIASTSALVQRDLTTEEMTSVAYHTSKAYAIASYGAPIGFSAGLWRAYTTRAQWRFPFYKPNPETFNPEKLLGLPPHIARAAWSSMRTTCYGTWSAAVGLLLVATYGSSVAAVGERSDPRMKNVIKEIQQKMSSGKTAEQAKRDAEKYYQERLQNRKGADGMHDDGEGHNQSDGWSAQQSDGFAQQQDLQRRLPKSQGESPYNMGSYGGTASSGRESDYFDDASPTAGSEPLGSSVSSSSTDSAWDRIRKGQGRAQNTPTSTGPSSRNPTGRPSSQQQPQADKDSAWNRARNANNPNAAGEDTSQQRQRQDGSNSFSFSAQDEERQLAKEEAQKEFDARVERERRGENFEDGQNRGGGRWR